MRLRSGTDAGIWGAAVIWPWQKKQVITIDRTMVAVACEIAASAAYAAEVTRQVREQLDPSRTFIMTSHDVTFTHIDFGEIKCAGLDFEWH